MSSLTSTGERIRFIGAVALVIGIAATNASTALAGPGMQTAGPTIMLKQPSVAKTGKNAFEVIVKDANGKPINDADVSILLVMPKAHAMAEMRHELQLQAVGNGMYAGSSELTMPGKWKVTVMAKKHGKTIATKKDTLRAS